MNSTQELILIMLGGLVVFPIGVYKLVEYSNRYVAEPPWFKETRVYYDSDSETSGGKKHKKTRKLRK